MKRLFTAAIAALLLASCDTYPPGDPYGAPYPPGDQYGTPHPPYPAPDPYGPQPYSPQAGACPIASSRDWRAWVDATPGPDNRPTLVVSGVVVAPTAGYRMEFEPHLQEQRSYPVQLTARLRAIPPAAPAAQVLTTHDVRWQWPLQSGPVGSATIVCGGQVLAAISPIPVSQ